MKTTILDEIIQFKQKEVKARKAVLPLNTLVKQERKRKHFSMKEQLLKEDASGIIAEFKRRSPSRNWINKEAVATQVIQGYEAAGVSGVSILTDHHFFGGRLSDLELAGKKINLPVLRKDFIINEYQIIEAAVAGADVILLIAANLTLGKVKQLAATAKQQGLEVLLEIHNQAELDHICEEVDMVGVNNRDLHTFKTDLQTSMDLSELIPDQFVKISESGIDQADDIKLLKKYGFKGFLVGERFMKTNNPGEACKEFVKALD
jgi:indole-3-glycerol phosphate synthase